jgi:NADH-quinone oxidoreductase subunit G
MIVEYINEAQKEQLENVESIVFSADITNEEAQDLQLLKENQGKSLISPEAKRYQDFLKAYSSSSGYHIFKGDIDTLATSDVVISLGVWFQDESTESTAVIRSILEEKKPKFVYMHPIEDVTLQKDITQFIKYEVGSEEGVAALLAYTLLEDKAFPEEIEKVLEDLDIGYLSAESNVGEEELESMYEDIDEKTTVSLIIGSDLYTHPKAEQIAKLIAMMEKYADINVVCIPPAKNALGVALICQLDDEVKGRSLDFESCQEGTYVNADQCVYMGQLSDMDRQKILDYSDQLPLDQGFRALNEDDLKQHCLYKLKPQERNKAFELDEIDDLPVYDGALVYTYKIQKAKLKEHQKSDVLYGSNQFAMATKLQDGDLISFEIEGVKFRRVFKIDTHLKGVIALNPVFDIKLSAYLISSYRFSRLAFEKIQ